MKEKWYWKEIGKRKCLWKYLWIEDLRHVFEARVQKKKREEKRTQEREILDGMREMNKVVGENDGRKERVSRMNEQIDNNE